MDEEYKQKTSEEVNKVREEFKKSASDIEAMKVELLEQLAQKLVNEKMDFYLLASSGKASWQFHYLKSFEQFKTDPQNESYQIKYLNDKAYFLMFLFRMLYPELIQSQDIKDLVAFDSNRKPIALFPIK